MVFVAEISGCRSGEFSLSIGVGTVIIKQFALAISSISLANARPVDVASSSALSSSVES